MMSNCVIVAIVNTVRRTHRVITNMKLLSLYVYVVTVLVAPSVRSNMSFKYKVGEYGVRVTELKNGGWRMSIYHNGKAIIQEETETSGEAFRQALIWLDKLTVIDEEIKRA